VIVLGAPEWLRGLDLGDDRLPEARLGALDHASGDVRLLV
jgi:hypothetical protein